MSHPHEQYPHPAQRGPQPSRLPEPYSPYPVQQVAPKSVAAGLILGLVIPGLGCMYAGRPGLGAGILAGWIASCILIVATIGVLLVPLMWILSGVLGYTSAKRWNAAHGIIS